jgi:four helix bundle protein
MSATPIRDYRDLLAWQKAQDLALLCEDVSDELPAAATNLTLQIRRAVNAVHANIAEGNGRFSRPDYLRHLSIANGSLRELESHLHFAVRRYGRTAATDGALELATLVAKLLAGLVRSLRGKSAR